MDEMIERVARAISRADVEATAKRMPSTPRFLIEAASQIAREDHLAMARAAIEAMRELEGAPRMAAYKAACNCGGAINTDEITKVWQAAIDAALNEQVAV